MAKKECETAGSAGVPPAPDGVAPAETTANVLNLQSEIEQLKATVATQKATIENLTTAKAEADEDEKLVQAKMGIGLSRDQAVAVVKRQKAYDASPLAKNHRKANETAAQKKAAAATA